MKIKDNLKEDTFNKPVLFVNDKVRVIVLPHNNNKRTMFVSFNNEQFVCFYNTGASSGGGGYNVSATDLTVCGRNYNFSYNKTQGFLKKEHAIEFDFLTIQKITNELDSEYTPYPNPTIIESAYIDDVSKDIYIVTRPQNDWGYDTFNIFVVKENNNFTRLKCNTVDRYRDGGTTFIYTDEGMLYTPTLFKKELKPTWTTINDVVSELIKLDDPRNHLGKEILDLLGL